MSDQPGGVQNVEEQSKEFDEHHFTPALTTTFTPPASCFGTSFTLAAYGVDKLDTSDSDTYYLTRGPTAPCYPPYFAPISSEVSVNGTGFTKTPLSLYSPGICPHSYTAASQQVDSNSLATTTCCPESYSLDTFYTTGSSAQCLGAVESPVVVYSDAISTGATGLVTAEPITIVNAPSDSTLFLASSTSSGDTAAAAASRPSTGIAQATSSPSAAPRPKGLTAGAEAGIGVGVSLGVIAILLVTWLGWRRKHKKKTSDAPDGSEIYYKTELSGEGKNLPQLNHGNGIYEASGHTKPSEMAAASDLAELDGRWRGWEVPGTEHR